MAEKVCVVAGVGPGNGTAFTRKFAGKGYRVAMLARSQDRLDALEAEIAGTKGYAVDIGDAAAIKETFEKIHAELGPVDVLIHNAAAGAFTSFMETPPEMLELTLRTNTISLLLLGQEAARDMLARSGGSIIVIGNTSAWRGVANYAAFAPSKAAQRILAQSMARSLGPQGVHVAYVVIDAVIDVPWARSFFKDKPDEYFCRPAAIAETVFHLTQQDRSAWSFEVDLRPFGEKW